MAKSTDSWTTVSLHPLIGMLDTRSRPADIPPGAFRWKLNMECTPEGKLCRRGGFVKLFSGAESYTNYDHHHQGDVREPITRVFESTSNDGTRRLFDFTQSRMSSLDATTGLYTDLLTGKGAAGSRWNAAVLQDIMVVTNGVDPIHAYDLTAGALPGPISSLSLLLISAAKVVVQYNGFIVLMNVVQDSNRHASRVVWSDLNLPLEYDPGATDSMAGYQDLDPGEKILAAAPMLSGLYIYTDRGIWKMSVSSDPDSIFSFTPVYTEPATRTGCLYYPDTLVSTGQEHWYMGWDGIYRYDPYIPAPVRDDWMHRADGVIYKPGSAQIDSTHCESPVGMYNPATRELWFSWPTANSDGINTMTLAGQIEQKTADVVDCGFTCFGTFRRMPEAGQPCSEVQDVIGASGNDWCLKALGGAFYREYAVLTDAFDPTADIPETAVYQQLGYDSLLRGMVPLGYTDREKIIRNVLLDHDTSEQDVPCLFRLRIGNSYSLVDPNNAGETCSVQWRQMGDLPVECPDQAHISDLTAKNQRAAIGTEWRMYVQGRFLYFELTITGTKNGSGQYDSAIGGDTCLQRIDFDAMAMPKA